MSIELSEQDIEFKNNNVKKYTNNQKKKLAERVESLTSKKHFKHIFKIIYEYTNLFTYDSSGVYIKISLLSNDILFKIENYLNSIQILNTHIAIPVPKNFIPYYSDEYSPKKNFGLKLSNHEKNIMKFIESDNNNTTISFDSDFKTSETNYNKPKIIIKPFNLE